MESNNTQLASKSLNAKLSQLASPQSESTIYRVHRQLRNVNPKAYEPEMIAIGPYHHDNELLKMMEGHKLRYVQQLLVENNSPDGVGTYVAALDREEAEARKCYADQPRSLTSAQFIEMLVLDGCFIIQLVRKFDKVRLSERNDPIFQMDWMINNLQRDLMLFENQLPFFVLCKLYDLIEVPGQYDRFGFLLLQFFSILYPGKGCRPLMPVKLVDPRQVTLEISVII